MSFKAPKKVLKPAATPAGYGDLPVYEFGAFRVDPRERQLLRDGTPVPLTAKAFDTLLLLISRSGHLVERTEIMRAVWPDSFVEEANLTVTIHMLRKALNDIDESSEHKYIETVAKRGYRFLGSVREVEVEGTPELKHALAAPSLENEAIITVAERKSSWLSHYPLRVSLLTVVSLAIVFFAVRAWETTEAGGKIQSLAVLPFRSLNPDANQDYLGLAMADAIITKLGTTGQVLVKPTSSVMKYANSADDPLSIGHEQKVDAILSGNIQHMPDRVRVTAQLVRVSDGSLLWADSFEETPQRMFALEGEVEERVARSMSVHLEKSVRAEPADRQSRNFNAYKLYLEGRYFWNKRTEEGLRRSIEYFQQATLEDPQYAAAYAGLADSYALLGSYGVEPTEQAYPNARSAALKALELDNSLSEAHTSLGMIAFYYEWNWPQAEHEFQRSIDLNPKYAMAHMWYADNLAAMGRGDEAMDQIRQAQELDPLSLIINTEVGRVFYFLRKYDQATIAYRKVLDFDPQFARAHTRLGMTFAAEQNFNDAVREFQLSQQLSGNDPYLDGLLGYAQAFAGNKAEARRLLQKLTQRAQREFVPAYSMALICVGLGERDRAMQLLAQSYTDRSTYMVYAKSDPLLDSVRIDPRFQDLMKQMGLL